MPSIRFDDQVVIITGAGRGIGRAHALYLADRGAKIVVNGLDRPSQEHSSQTAPEAVVAEIEARGGHAIVCHGDVSNEAAATALVDAALREWGRVDALINNAGFVRDRSFTKMPPEDFNAVVQTHLFGSVNCTRAVLPAMKQRRYGRILMTTSGAGFYGNFGQSNYSTAKLGVIGLMQTLRLEVARDGILVNALAPTALTKMNEAFMPPALWPQVTTDSVAAAAAFLVSEECKLNGETLVAGGGRFARMQFAESRGVRGGQNEMTPEFIATHWAEISDMQDAHAFADGSEAFQATFGYRWPER